MGAHPFNLDERVSIGADGSIILTVVIVRKCRDHLLARHGIAVQVLISRGSSLYLLFRYPNEQRERTGS